MANLKNTVISDTGFFKLPIGDTAARPASPAATQLRFNTDTGQLEQFRPGLGAWIAPSNTGVIATGGDAVYDVETEGTTYRVHVFTSTGTSSFSVLQGGEAEYLIVAGGGGGGDHRNRTGTATAGGGGGAGGLLTGSLSITQSDYNVSVGEGGINPNGQTGVNGDDSSAFGLTAIGGGGGGSRDSGANSGGSGGGVGYANNTGGVGTAGQGNNGGDSNNNTFAGTGGGGAGEPGVGFPSTTGSTGTGTRGGNGLNLDITGVYTFYAGGGGGGDAEDAGTDQGADGGLGGGGAGSGAGDLGVGPNNAQPGVPNTGGGGGGAASEGTNGGDGGSGIVIIRYPLRQENPEVAAGKVVGDGLVLDLDFAKPTVNSGSGTAVNDSRLNGITGTLINGPVFINPRTHKSAFSFDGIDDHINIPNFSALANSTACTISIWSNVRENKGYHFWGELIFLLQIQSDQTYRLRFHLDGSYRANYYIAYPLNIYHKLDITWDGTTTKAYINSQETVSSTADSAFSSFSNTTNQPLQISRRSSDYSNADIAQVLIYNRALTSSEILQNFNATRWRFGV